MLHADDPDFLAANKEKGKHIWWTDHNQVSKEINRSDNAAEVLKKKEAEVAGAAADLLSGCGGGGGGRGPSALTSLFTRINNNHRSCSCRFFLLVAGGAAERKSIVRTKSQFQCQRRSADNEQRATRPILAKAEATEVIYYSARTSMGGLVIARNL